MYGSDNGRKLKTASKFIAGFLGIGAVVLFILPLAVADTVNLAIFIPAFIVLITYLFAAWLSYHILNAIGNTAINSEIMIERLEKLLSKTAGFNEAPMTEAEIKKMKMKTCPKCGEVSSGLFCASCNETLK